MATLTVAEAARRLGVKPAKVRQYIAEHRLSAHVAPPADGRRGQPKTLLDADEVETLANVRAFKQRLRSAALADQSLKEPTGAPIAGAVVEGAAPSDPSGQRTVALVQSMLAPLVAELHDARETIRRQAEELGALRAAVAELQRPVAPVAPIVPDAAPGTHDADAAQAPVGPSATARPRPADMLLWRRAVIHLRGR